MPLSSKGEDIMSAMKKEYGGKQGEAVFYASKNKGTISGVDRSDADEGTAKAYVLKRHPNAKLELSNDARACYVIKAGGTELGESHGGKGLAWTNAAKALGFKKTARGHWADSARNDELSPLADRIDALNQRADTVADRHFEAARQDAVRSARADVTKVSKVEAGRQRPKEAGRFMPRGDADGDKHFRVIGQKGGRENTYNIMAKDKDEAIRKAKSGSRDEFTSSTGTTWSAMQRGDADEGVNQRQMPRRDADFADPWVVQFQDPEGYSNPPAYTVRATDRNAAVSKAREMLNSRWAENETQKRRAKSFTLKSITRKDDEMGRPDTDLNLAVYASPAQNAAFPETDSEPTTRLGAPRKQETTEQFMKNQAARRASLAEYDKRYGKSR